MKYDKDPRRCWKQKNFDASESFRSLPLEEQLKKEVDRDMAKPVEQLVFDVHTETHDPNRNELANLAGAQKRFASLMARVAKSNERLMWAIAIMTSVLVILTVITATK